MGYLEEHRADGVVIVAGDDECELADEALDVGIRFLRPGGRLVVYGQHLQPLATRQGVMRSSDGFIDVRLHQLFTREYQVLPQRTHPIMQPDAMLMEGFVLTASKVLTNESASKRQRVG